MKKVSTYFLFVTFLYAEKDVKFLEHKSIYIIYPLYTELDKEGYVLFYGLTEVSRTYVKNEKLQAILHICELTTANTAIIYSLAVYSNVWKYIKTFEYKKIIKE